MQSSEDELGWRVRAKACGLGDAFPRGHRPGSSLSRVLPSAHLTDEDPETQQGRSLGKCCRGGVQPRGPSELSSCCLCWFQRALFQTPKPPTDATSLWGWPFLELKQISVSPLLGEFIFAFSFSGKVLFGKIPASTQLNQAQSWSS